MQLKFQFTVSAHNNHRLKGCLARLFNDLTCSAPGTCRHARILDAIRKVKNDLTSRETNAHLKP